MKYQFIKDHPEHNIDAVCFVLGVPPSGYYAWRERPVSEREKDNQRILSLIEDSFEQSHNTYGIRRITEDLNDLGEACHHKRVQRLKQAYNIYPKQVKQRINTTDSNHNGPIFHNYLRRNFTVDAPNQVWVSDLTYVRVNNNWMYLVVWIDLYSRKVTGWAMANHRRRSLMVRAWQMGIDRRGCAPLLVHSDRGSQYASDEFLTALKPNDILSSMSRRGDCFDNAVSESFFATIKKECIYLMSFDTYEQARTAILKYIETFYNTRRKHSFLNYCSPDQFEHDTLAA